MAQLRNCVIGNFSGSIGEIVIKYRYGKPYASSRPVNFQVCQKPHMVQFRNKFTFLNALSKAMSKDFFINNCWKKSLIPATSARRKMMKINYHLVDSMMDISSIYIVPEDIRFDAEVNSAEMQGSNLILSITPSAPASVTDFSNSEISVHGVMQFSGALNQQKYDFAFAALSSGTEKISDNSPLIFNIPVDMDIAANYSEMRFLVILIITNSSREPQYFSVNINGIPFSVV